MRINTLNSLRCRFSAGDCEGSFYVKESGVGAVEEGYDMAAGAAAVGVKAAVGVALGYIVGRCPSDGAQLIIA